ncbi:MAG: hypothetical protein ACRD3F_14055 [Acidobacteriaceae bacterium]
MCDFPQSFRPSPQHYALAISAAPQRVRAIRSYYQFQTTRSSSQNVAIINRDRVVPTGLASELNTFLRTSTEQKRAIDAFFFRKGNSFFIPK